MSDAINSKCVECVVKLNISFLPSFNVSGQFIKNESESRHTFPDTDIAGLIVNNIFWDNT